MFTKSLESKIDSLLELEREHNALLRELILAITQRPAQTRSGPAKPHRIATGKDVTVMTREMREEQDFRAREAAAAPHRTPASGPGSGTTRPNGTPRPNGPEADGSPTG